MKKKRKKKLKMKLPRKMEKLMTMAKDSKVKKKKKKQNRMDRECPKMSVVLAEKDIIRKGTSLPDAQFAIAHRTPRAWV